MLKRLATQGKNRKWLAVIAVAFALMIGLLCFKYHRYAYAAAWHCTHGNYAELAGHRVKLPILWWKEDAHAYDTVLLERACPANTYLKPEIVVSPAIPGSIRDTDQDELKATQAAISSRNQDSFVGTSSLLVVLSPRPFNLYCKRENIVTSGIVLSSNLFCLAPKAPYSFTYDGPPTREKEAETILSSLE